ncbi:putative protease AXL1 [Nakaseomyces bracarensis]|uniref:Protease AXL1 n=1 Tax=Nakaseomyces bracarensis TaxID=273131 RepID=A0ABR4NY50_9SACH
MSVAGVKKFESPVYIPLSHINRNYKLVQLSNGITIVIISDPEDTFNSCSLTVASGSHNDPDDILGLAHLCEHMILGAGSQAYPEPGLFYDELMKNGGDQNAYTTGEQTTFYFHTPQSNGYEGAPVFERLLSIFSASFKKPLFSMHAINKELYAIESEHQKNVVSEGKVFYHALRLLSNKNHPFSRFCTGNIHTLKTITASHKVNLKKALTQYYDENFFGKNMTICIRGPQSVNHLIKLCLTYFNDIRPLPKTPLNRLRHLMDPSVSSTFTDEASSNMSMFTTDKVLNPFRKELTRHDIKKMNILHDRWVPKYGTTECFSMDSKNNLIVFNSDIQDVFRLVFPIRSDINQKDSTLTDIFANHCVELLGDESEGSFCHFLKKIGWVRDCFVFKSDIAVGISAITVEFRCLPAGFLKIENIIRIFFSKVVTMLLNTQPVEMTRYLYEQTIIETIEFLYSRKNQSPMDECSNISSELQKNISAKGIHYLLTKNPTLLHKYGHISKLTKQNWWDDIVNLLKEFISLNLTIKNMKILLPSKEKFNKIAKELFKYANFDDSKKSNDPYFDFSYKVISISFPDSNLVFPYMFTFPEANSFIPPKYSNLDNLWHMMKLICLKSKDTHLKPIVKSKLLRSKTEPRLINKSDDYEMWMAELPDHSITNVDNVDVKSYVTIELANVDIIPSPMATIHLEMLAELMNIFLEPVLYPSTKLGFSFYLRPSLDGNIALTMTLTGVMSGLFKVFNEVEKLIELILDSPGYVLKSEHIRKARLRVRSRYEDISKSSAIKLATTGMLVLLEENMWDLQERYNALENNSTESFFEFITNFFHGSKYAKIFTQSHNHSNFDKLTKYVIEHILKKGERENKVLYLQQQMSRVMSNSVKLHKGVDYFFEMNGNKEDPNNCVMFYLQLGSVDDMNLKRYHLIEFTDYIFQLTLVKQLRSKKQLGYAIDGGLLNMKGIIGLHITVMSNLEPRHIEYCIEEYLTNLEKFIKSNFDHLWKGYSKIINERNTLEYLLDHDIWYIIEKEEYEKHQTDHSDHICQRFATFKYRELNEKLQGNKDRPISESNITLGEYLDFYTNHIVERPKKSSRSKVSVWVNSPMPKEDILTRHLKLQLETFLKIKGLVIPEKELLEIIKEAGGKQSTMLKLLYKRFKKQNEAFKFVNILAVETFRAITLQGKSGATDHFDSMPSNGSSSSSNKSHLDDSRSFDSSEGSGSGYFNDEYDVPENASTRLENWNSLKTRNKKMKNT